MIANDRAALLQTKLAQHLRQEIQLRKEVRDLSTQELATLIPHGPYCYTVLTPLPPPAIGQRIDPCPFLMGSRPDTTCFLNPAPLYAIDTLYNPDACKRCGINDAESDDETP
jgi:hypothetical protein